MDLLVHGAVALNLLHHKLLAVKVHHVQARQCLVCQLGVKKSGIVKLQGQLVLAHLAVGALLMGRHLDVKQRHPVAHVHAVFRAALVLGLQAGVAVLYIPLRAVLSHDPKAPGQVVKLADQLDHHQHQPPIGPVGRLRGVPA